MKVRCTLAHGSDLVLGKEYIVAAELGGFYRILTGELRNELYQMSRFEPLPMKIEFDFHGFFRIVSPSGNASPWVPYTSIACLSEKNGKIYIAGSQYGLLPKDETVFEISALGTALSDSGHESCKHYMMEKGGVQEYVSHCEFYNKQARELNLPECPPSLTVEEKSLLESESPCSGSCETTDDQCPSFRG